ncbi:hyothetical protein [Photobacterium aphoticum]|uniref:Hyothetical protein n=1 Tax=Photobacterium aphoticum TaxID=754436 RepID=A0A090QPW9_9GAMM|nr:hyothetical protein [Photobacterium aphoticum]
MVDSTQYDGVETTVNEFRWEKSGNTDITLNEFFTYFSESTAFGTEDITHQVLTSSGWKGLFSYLQVVFATQTTALLTDAALTQDDEAGITLDANVYSLNGKKCMTFYQAKTTTTSPATSRMTPLLTKVRPGFTSPGAQKKKPTCCVIPATIKTLAAFSRSSPPMQATPRWMR